MNQRILTRLLLLLLSLALCVSLFACGEEADPEDTTPTDQADPTDPDVDPEPEPEPEILPDVEMKDYDYELGVLHWTVDGAHEFYNLWLEICPGEGITSHVGDLIADDIFDRTGWLEENYGITINCRYEGHVGTPTTISNLIKSGSDEYQVMVEFGFNAQRTMGQGYYADLSTYGNIDPEKPWWVKESFDALALGDYVEFATSDMLLLDKGATSVVFFNIPMSENLGLGNLYSYVEQNEWTFDTMLECAEDAYIDDGNDIRDGNDIYGFSNSGDIPVQVLYFGAGQKLLARNADDEYYYSYGTDEGTLDVMTSILEDLMYADFYWNDYQTKSEVHPQFTNGGALFSILTARYCSTFRSMEDAYGILPVPKFDADQEKYYSQVNTYHDSMLAILNTAEEEEAVSAALEAMSYYSYYNIYPDFYDVVIQGRGTRDEESREMLNIAFSSRTYDLGLVYDPIGFSDTVLRYTSTGDSNLSSFIQSWETRLENAANQLNELASDY